MENSEIQSEALPCLVCDSPTKVTHFQLNVCRACAAFFRRSIDIEDTYVCQTNTKNCNVKIKTPGKPLCRYCRYLKCIEVGMKLNNNSSKKDDLPLTNLLAKKNANKHETNIIQIIKKQINENENENEDEIQKMKYEVKKNAAQIHRIITLSFGDFDNVFMHVLKMFKQTPTKIYAISNNYSETYLNDFNLLLFKFLETTNPKDKLVFMTDNDYRVNFVKDFYLNVTKMLCDYQPFANLPFKDKVLLHNEFWQSFYYLDRNYQTCQYYGSDVDDLRYLIDDSQYIDIALINYLFTENKFPQEYVEATLFSFLHPLFIKAENDLKRFKKINPSFFEFSYVCQMFLWSCFDLKGLEESTHQVAESVEEKLSENLHKYYSEDLRMPVYAARQAKLYRLVNSTRSCLDENKELYTVVRTFSFAKQKLPCCPFFLESDEFFNKLSLS